MNSNSCQARNRTQDSTCSVYLSTWYIFHLQCWGNRYLFVATCKADKADKNSYTVTWHWCLSHRANHCPGQCRKMGARWHSLMVLVFSSQITVCSHNIAYTPFYQNNLPENTEHNISKSLPVCLFCAKQLRIMSSHLLLGVTTLLKY